MQLWPPHHANPIICFGRLSPRIPAGGARKYGLRFGFLTRVLFLRSRADCVEQQEVKGFSARGSDNSVDKNGGERDESFQMGRY